MSIDINCTHRRASIKSHAASPAQRCGHPRMHSPVLAMSILLAMAIGCDSAPNVSSNVISNADDGTTRSDDVAETVLIGDLPDDLPPANRHIFEGGTTESVADTQTNNAVPNGEQRDDGEFNIPTNGPPSPLFGAEPFSQKMLRFEEFGPDAFEPTSTSASADAQPPLNFNTLPAPPDAQSVPDGESLDEFLFQPLFPPPTEFANDRDQNPWRTQIESFIGRALDTPPAEGRPPGPNWAHQRWDEFFPQTTFTTVTTGARVNGGVRDEQQSHGYLVGEFGPGGLYHAPAGDSGDDGSAAGIPARFHPMMPAQLPESLWTFDGTFPPKLLSVRYGEPVLMRHYNALPIDIAANRGFGVHTTTTYEHNGHNPAESDGYTNAFFFPGQFYDYHGRSHWPGTTRSILTPTIRARVHRTASGAFDRSPVSGARR